MVRGIFYAVFQTFLHEKNQRFSPVLFLCRQGGNGMNYDMKESGKRIAELSPEEKSVEIRSTTVGIRRTRS